MLFLAVVISLEVHLKVLLPLCLFPFAWQAEDPSGASLWIGSNYHLYF